MNPNHPIIVDLVTEVDRRIRRQDQTDFLTRTFIWSLAIPALLTGLSLVVSVPPWAIITLLAAWVIVIGAAAVWTWTHRPPLSRAAAEIDRRAALNNELTSALWFVQHEESNQAHAWSHTKWVDLHVARAAERVPTLEPEALFPWRWPDEARTAAALAGVLIVLNALMAIDLVPRSWTRAWLQARLSSSSRTLSEDDKKKARELQELLQKIDRLDPALMTPQDRRLAKELTDVIRDLENDALTSPEAAERLARIRQALEALAESERGEKPIEARPKPLTARDLKQLEEAFQRALQESKSAKSEQADEGERTPDDKLRSEARAEMRDATLKRLKELEKSMGQPQNSRSRQERGTPEKNQGGEPGNEQEGAQSSAEAPGQGQMQPMDGDGQQQGLQARGSMGGASSGSTTLVGPRTSLQVKLRRELLASATPRPSAGREPEKEEERFQETKQGRSKQDFRPVTARPRYAAPDAMEPNQVPWPYRDLVKAYFQKVGPRGK